ncbi:hypothetical protein NMY22_g19081 [Coprinellus aureogranulatus]|nr:hypothetical protein NMY22_g19081 [Coprinellus aureogranulatus]
MPSSSTGGYHLGPCLSLHGSSLHRYVLKRTFKVIRHSDLTLWTWLPPLSLELASQVSDFLPGFHPLDVCLWYQALRSGGEALVDTRSVMSSLIRYSLHSQARTFLTYAAPGVIGWQRWSKLVSESDFDERSQIFPRIRSLWRSRSHPLSFSGYPGTTAMRSPEEDLVTTLPPQTASMLGARHDRMVQALRLLPSNPLRRCDAYGQLFARYLVHLFGCTSRPRRKKGATAYYPSINKNPLFKLPTFISYILRRTDLPSTVIFSALILVQRLKCVCPPGERSAIGHRIILSALMLSAKYLLERTYDNRSWRIASGRLFSLQEINQMERDMCLLLDWDLTIDNEILENFTTTLFPWSRDAL